MKSFICSVLALALLTVATSSSAWWSNNGWGGDNWSAYDEWGPRYRMEESGSVVDNDYYDPARYGYAEPYGRFYGTPYGYGDPYGYGGTGLYGGPVPYGPRYQEPAR